LGFVDIFTFAVLFWTYTQFTFVCLVHMKITYESAICKLSYIYSV